MENVYFVRHNFSSENLDNQREVRVILKKEECIAIHFNEDEPLDEKWEVESEKTTDSKFKKAAKVYSQIKNSGGYVLAQYDGSSGEIYIGKVNSQSPIFYLPALTKKNLKGYKCLKIENLKPFKLSKYPILFAIRPIQQTLARMGDIGTEIVKQIYETGKLKQELKFLTPQFQELIVQEWLRSEYAKDLQIKYQLILTGKDYPSVDIIGRTNNGETLFAQVTYHSESSNKKKFEYFQELAKKDKNPNNLYVMFSNQKVDLQNGEVIFKKLDAIFSELKTDEIYKMFLKNIFEGIE